MRTSFPFVLILIAGCGRAPQAEHAESTGGLPPVRVTVQVPQRKTLQRSIELPGQVLAYEEAPLLAKVTGQPLPGRVSRFRRS